MKAVWFALAMMSVSTACAAQAIPDASTDVSVERPAYARDQGPVIGVDAGHNNYHTIEGRYAPFAAVLRNDGYRVVSVGGAITPSELKPLRGLVISNALAKENVNNWALPTPSAFSPDEISALRAWVAGGGALLLIADHMPFPGAVTPLAAAFGFDFDNCYAVKGDGTAPEIFSLSDGSLEPSAITRGTGRGAPVTEVQTFAGSSFSAPPGATPIMRLDDGWTLLEPAEAGKFTADTPRRTATKSDLRAAALEFGKGRVVVVAEAALFTTQLVRGVPFGFAQPSARQDKQLLLNIAEWLSRAPSVGRAEKPGVLNVGLLTMKDAPYPSR